MYNFDSCSTKTQYLKIVLREKKNSKSKFIGLNSNRKSILQVQVDHCLEIQGKRCDWLLIDISDNAAHFVELKGHRIQHALLQLINSITIISEPQNGYIDQEFSCKKAYAILSHCPIDSNEIQKAKITFKKKYKAELIVKNNQIEQPL